MLPNIQRTGAKAIGPWLIGWMEKRPPTLRKESGRAVGTKESLVPENGTAPGIGYFVAAFIFPALLERARFSSSASIRSCWASTTRTSSAISMEKT